MDATRWSDQYYFEYKNFWAPASFSIFKSVAAADESYSRPDDQIKLLEKAAIATRK